jgi:regulator of RNase E activity RraA
MVRILTTLLFCTMSVSSLSGQGATVEQLKHGVGFITTEAFSGEQNRQLLKLYEGLRVADVSDGMDRVGLPDVGLIHPSIQPAWKDPDSLRHQFRGIALTVRYVPSNHLDRPEPGQDFGAWEGNFYNTLSSEPFMDIIQPGTVVVIDDVEESDIGSIGSFNILAWYQKGAVGVVTDASARDTDEIEIERVPLYLRKRGRGIRPGRNMLESVNRPVSIGGVLVMPGDIIVADGDGVIAVPRRVAEQVAWSARAVLDQDKAARKGLYERMGLPMDPTVR